MYVKTGSIFEKTKVPLAKWLHVVVLWTIETSVTNLVIWPVNQFHGLLAMLTIDVVGK
jgi:hypothetical protein